MDLDSDDNDDRPREAPRARSTTPEPAVNLPRIDDDYDLLEEEIEEAEPDLDIDPDDELDFPLRVDLKGDDSEDEIGRYDDAFPSIQVPTTPISPSPRPVQHWFMPATDVPLETIARAGPQISLTAVADIAVPKNRRAMLETKEKEHWIEAEREEMRSFQTNQVLAEVKPSTVGATVPT